MALEPGTRLGPYEVTGQLGAGGMGEVCRARDTKLNREVALKVLPQAFAADPQRMTRFHREAQLLATLNHPNIAAIHGFEDGPPVAIVMELVEGETLAAMIDRGPLPLDEALQIAKQIAEALEYAHDRGVVHRDLKPANIKVAPGGAVKVLDFGLAKALGDSADSSLDLNSMSPTLSLAATQAGVILGTAAYMAPEQAKGKGADRRSDIWAFGVVLYEMLAGARMFAGDSVAETLASVMKDQLTFAGLPAATPTRVRRLVSRCLERDIRRRLQSIAEARIVIDDAIAGVPDDAATAVTAAAPASARWLWAVTVAAVLAAVGVGAWAWSRPQPAAPAPAHFTWTLPEGVRLTASAPNAPQVAVSPDGRQVAFVADEGDRDRTIWVRDVGSLEARRLDLTEGAMFPFWSPDGRQIAYFTNGRLLRVSVAGGAPLEICATQNGEGGTWFQRDGEDGVIVFAPSARSALQRVAAKGGAPEPFTTLADGETGHSFPQFLPDGERVVYLAEGRKPGVFVWDPASKTATPVVEGLSRAMFAPPDVFVYVRNNTLLAHRWNLDTLQLEGEPLMVVDGVRSGVANGRNAFSVSATGVLAYRAGITTNNRVAWYTRDGKPDGVVLDAGRYGPIDLSPDGSRLLVIRGTGDDRDLWVKELASGVFSKLTTTSTPDFDPVWSPDSRRVVYRNQAADFSLYETVFGSGKHTLVAGSDGAIPADWTRDGKQLLVHGGTAGAGSVVRLLSVKSSDGTAKEMVASEPLLTGNFLVDQFQISPDGAWVVYLSLESGAPQIMIAPFPSFSERRQVSSGGTGATQPLWRADGKELFFVERGGVLKAVDVRAGTRLELGPVRTLFPLRAFAESNVSHMYAVTPDGQRFLVRETPELADADGEKLYVMTNWTSLLAK